MIGVLGAYGAVGRVAAARLAALGVGPLRLGGRDLRRARALADDLDGAGPVRVDLADPASLAAFCAGCRLVLNCAGPSYRVLATVARAALAAGAACVDAAGDRVALRDLARDTPAPQAPVVCSAGVMPGLSGLLPRLLLDGEPPARLEVYAGGAVPLTRTSALDTLLTRGPDFGTPFAAWRHGRVVERALEPQRGVTLPGFDGPVDAVPFLTVEAAELGAAFGLPEVRAFSVYASEHLPAALALAWADEATSPEEHAADVMAAAAADVAGRDPAYTLLARAHPAAGPPRQVCVRTGDPYGLSGVVVAQAAVAVLEGSVPPGAHLAAGVLEPRALAGVLATDPVVTDLEVPWAVA